MNSKHTPGPWSAGITQRGTWSVFTCDGNSYNVLDASAPIVKDKGEANALLIAAAPELLEALKELAADPYLSDPINADRMAKARAAIRKATGTK